MYIVTKIQPLRAQVITGPTSSYINILTMNPNRARNYGLHRHQFMPAMIKICMRSIPAYLAKKKKKKKKIFQHKRN